MVVPCSKYCYSIPKSGAPNMDPKRKFAKCDTDSTNRNCLGVLHGHDDIAGFFEDGGLYVYGHPLMAAVNGSQPSHRCVQLLILPRTVHKVTPGGPKHPHG